MWDGRRWKIDDSGTVKRLAAETIRVLQQEYRHDGDEIEPDRPAERRTLAPRLRFAILKRDHFQCQLCGASKADGVRLEVDHKRPRSAGGSDDPRNLWTLCRTCNRGKFTTELD